MSEQTFIIIGASLTGAKAAEELRTQGFDGRLLLIGSESERPYERPPLTKDYLRGESEREKTYVHEPGFYEQHRIELLTGSTATSIDAGASRVTLADGQELSYDRLLLATGAEPRRLSSTSTPFSTFKPASRASFTRGVTPIPTTAKSQSTSCPSPVRTRLTPRSPSNASTPVPSSSSIPCWACTSR